MHGEKAKIINARQAKVCNNYKSTKLKLLKTNAALWFNKMCKTKQLKPNYIPFKTNNNLQD
jgi:enoyl reductase-like protein